MREICTSGSVGGVGVFGCLPYPDLEACRPTGGYREARTASPALAACLDRATR